MDNFLTDDHVHSIVCEINEDYGQIHKLEQQIFKIKLEIDKKKKELIAKCKHNKLINYIVLSEHTEYYCDKCGMHL